MVIASDYDGTVYKNGTISEKDRNALKLWQEKGGKFGIVTGRGQEILHQAEKNGVSLDYAVAYNGACVIDQKGKILYEEYFTLSLKEPYFAFVNDFPQTEPGTVQYALKHPEDGDIEENRCGIYQFSLVLSTDAEAAALTDALNQKFGDLLVSYANGRCINTVKKGVSKATGIAQYAGMVGVKDEDIYVVGDNYNDLPMLYAYDGYCVNSACEDMRRRIKNHCEDMTELTQIAYQNEKNRT